MKFSFTLLCVFLFSMAHSQLLTWSPDFITEQTTNNVITADATKGNQGLLNYNPNDVYVHIGVVTNKSNGQWSHVSSVWATTNAAYKAVSLGNNKWSFTISANPRTYFGVTDATETILKIGILFRSGDGSKALRNSDGSDMYVPVYAVGLQTRIIQPYRQPTFTPIPETVTYTAGSTVAVSAVASTSAALQLLYNGVAIATATGTSITASPTIAIGNNQIIATATSGAVTKADTLSFYVNSPVVTQALPAGVRDGLNYGSDGKSVTLVLYAPSKTRAGVIGEFNNWTRSTGYEMYRTPDGTRYWLTLTGLTSGQEYAYQYVVDDTLKVADMFAEKILDKDNDPSIDAQTYPNLKAYPTGQSGIVSVLQTSKPAYSWQVSNFAKPDKRNLVIYELLIRDFVAAHNWKTVKDSLPYLKSLGVNAIEVMPFSEFEGNSSWGYNPDFFFAPDKYYGTETDVKAFVDECHKQGIAVIMDMVMNHAFGSSPTVQLYWDPINNRPAANNPWHNVVATHPFSVGYDFNHESPATQELVQRVVEHWLTNYKIDGFRWDLSKGFTQTVSTDDSQFRLYDLSRITTWKRIYDTMQQTVPGSYCILEHFAENSEETELSNYGMMLWGNENYNYNQATMGYLDNNGSDFSYGIYSARSWTNPNLVTYMESHDEERLMYKNEQYGNSSGSYNVKNIPTGLQRNAMAAAFWAVQPAPKMVWQFGELGYDYSINTCEDGVTISNDCRTSPKPVRWDYLTDPNRAALRNVYSRLFALRNYAAYLPAFTAPKDSISYSLGAAFKWEKINSTPLDIAVIGNFDVVTQGGSITFSHTGTWYDYLAGTTFTVTNTTQQYTLQPGEYHVFIDQNASAVLPLQLLSFSGFRSTNAILLNWNTANEKNLGSFAVQRSFNGIDFTAIGTVAAANETQYSYAFADKDAAAVHATGYVYYKLKTIDKDGGVSYSAVVRIDASTGNTKVVLYPNPVRNGVAYLRFTGNTLSGTMQVNIADASGRICINQTLLANAGGSAIEMNVSSLANGVYHVKIMDSKGAISTKKLIIQR